MDDDAYNLLMLFFSALDFVVDDRQHVMDALKMHWIKCYTTKKQQTFLKNVNRQLEKSVVLFGAYFRYLNGE